MVAKSDSEMLALISSLACSLGLPQTYMKFINTISQNRSHPWQVSPFIEHYICILSTYIRAPRSIHPWLKPCNNYCACEMDLACDDRMWRWKGWVLKVTLKWCLEPLEAAFLEASTTCQNVSMLYMAFGPPPWTSTMKQIRFWISFQYGGLVF
jgi:hypothetical protein